MAHDNLTLDPMPSNRPIVSKRRAHRRPLTATSHTPSELELLADSILRTEKYVSTKPEPLQKFFRLRYNAFRVDNEKSIDRPPLGE